jgi:hypothetical protein
MKYFELKIKNKNKYIYIYIYVSKAPQINILSSCQKIKKNFGALLLISIPYAPERKNN